MRNRERIDQMFALLGEAILPFIQERLEVLYGGVGRDELLDAAEKARRSPGEDPLHDVRFLLGFLTYRWNEFRDVLAREERTHINELIDVRNTMAHDFREPSDDYAWRALDTGGRLLVRIDAPRAVALVRLRDEVRASRAPVPSMPPASQPHAAAATSSTPAPAGSVDAIAAKEGRIVVEVMNLMGETAAELGLVVEDSHAARKYSRHGGAKVWIDPAQRSLVVDLRTLRLRSPQVDADALRRAIVRLFSDPNVSDQPRIALLRRLVDAWPEFRADVLEPFFGADVSAPSRGGGGDHCQRARRFGVPCDRSITRFAVLDRDGWECRMDDCLYETRTIDPRVIFSGRGQIPDEIGTIDHITPLSEPGSPGHVWDNVRAAHRLCNREAYQPSRQATP